MCVRSSHFRSFHSALSITVWIGASHELDRATRRATMTSRMLLQHMATAGCIGAGGDIMMQEIESPGVVTQADLDSPRTARIVAYRVAQAPLLDLFWKRFDAWATALKLSGGRGVIFKVACDQSLCSPFFLTMFYVSQGLLEGRSLAEACQRTRAAAWPTWLSGFKFYGCVHIVTFAFVPIRYRIAWNSCAAVFWTAYLSHTNQTLRHGHPPDDT